MSARPFEAPAAAAVEPRDAGSLLVVDRRAGGPRVLFGRRRSDLKFAPGRYVFPGGSVDACDLAMAPIGDLQAEDHARLGLRLSGEATPARLRALALAALRETGEETGLMIGRRVSPGLRPQAPAGWLPSVSLDVVPDLGALRLLARAITPPGRPRRFDARFFCVDAAAIAHDTGRRDDEFSEIVWLDLQAARERDLHSMTRAILDDLEDALVADELLRPDWRVPFYHQHDGAFIREFLDRPSRA